jgi:hypothetical protein
MKNPVSLSLLLIFLLSAPALPRDKTDIVWLTNGDRITGEIEQLEHGKLQVGTDALGQVRIEWDDISRIESDYQFQFERTDGTRITGTIQRASDQQEITLVGDKQTVNFAHDNVVRISQIEDTFWNRLKGSLTFGYSFTKASNVAQGNLGVRATHRTEVRSFTLDGSTIITSDQADDNTQRSNLSLSTTRFRSNRWFNSYVLGFESNDELGLNLRSSLGAGLGRYLIQTNASELSLIGGLVGTAENLKTADPDPGTESTGDKSRQESLEGMLGVDYSRYIFDDPTVDFSARLYAFPSITESGRTRAQLDINLRWELINDLFWDLNYYNSFDSDPPSGSESTNDYGIVTSIGYSF